MKAKNIYILITGIILLAVTLSTSAQESTTMHFMKGMPQATMYNPALHNDSSAVVIGLPGLSGIYFGLNSDFAVNDLIHYGTNDMKDSLVLDIDNFYSSLKDQNYFRQDFEVSLFYLGFRTKKLFFNFGINEKESARFGFGKGLISFLKDGNSGSIGEVQDLGDITFDAYHYREYALGVSSEFMDGRLTLGAKFKALYGKAAIQTNKLNFQVATAGDGSSVEFTTAMDVNFASPLIPEYDENNYLDGFDDNFTANDYILNTENMGMAFDLGAVFKLNPKITLSASLVDIGKIPFKTGVYNINHTGSFLWKGIELNSTLEGAGDKFDEEIDDLEEVIKPKRSEVSTDAFDLSLPTKVFIGGTYEMNDKLNFGLLDRMYVYNGETVNTLSVSANAMLARFFSISGSYSNISGTSNVGLGMALRLGFLQLYMVNDNLLALSDPAKAQFVNVRFGLNILFGRNYQKFVH